MRTKKAASEDVAPMRPTLSPEVRENQMISLAMDLVEKRLREGTASSAETTHFLKLATVKSELEKKKLEAENTLLHAKADAIQAAKDNIDYIEIKERYNATSSDDKNTVEAVARVVKGSTYTTVGGATVTFASNGTATAKDYSGTLVGYRYMTLTEVSEQVASTQSALADADEMNVDQAYRLTLLELGVTDDETT